MTQPTDTPAPKSFAPVLEAAEHFLKEAFDRLRHDFEKQLHQFNSGMKEHLSPWSGDLARSTEDSLCEAWTAMDNWLKSLAPWMNFDHYPELRSTLILEGIRQLEPIVSNLPQRVSLEWQPSFFQVDRNDSLSISTYKRFKNLSIKIGSKTSAIKATVLKKNNRNRPQTHLFYPGDAAQVLILIPYFTLLSSALDRTLACGMQLLFQRHELSCDNVQASLGLDPDDRKRGARDMLEALNESGWPEYPAANTMDKAFGTLWLEIRADFKAFETEVIKSWRHATSFSGTWIYPHRRYSGRKYRLFRKKFNRTQDTAKKLWGTYFTGEGKDWSHDIALCRIQLQVAFRTFKTLASVREKLLSEIIPHCNHAIETLMKTKERLLSREHLEEKVSRKNMIQECRLLLDRLGKELLPTIARQVLGAGIGQDLSTIHTLARERTEGLSDTHMVLRSRDNHVPPQSELVAIPIRELFTEEFLTRLESDLSKFQHKMRITLDETLNGMSDIRKSVEFNMESSFALIEKEQDTEGAYQMITEGIDRSLQQLKTTMDTILALPETVRADLIAIASDWIISIQSILDNDKLIALKLKLARAKAKGRMKKVSSGFIDRLITLWKTSRSTSMAWYGKGREKIDEIKGYLGMVPQDEGIQIQFSQFLLDTRKKLDDLPFVYQQLFQNEPLEDDRLFQGRVEDLKALNEDMLELADAKEVLTVVVGEKGSGKTTLLNMMILGLPKDWHVHTLTLTRTVVDSCDLLSLFEPLRPEKPFSSLQDLESFLMTDARPSLFIMENIQNLFVKTMDGFKHLEDVLAMVNRTRGRVAWVCSCTLYGWEYLDKAMGISGYFKRIQKLQPFSRDDIESMIMARHRITGYQLKFLVSRKIRLSRPYRKLETETDRQAYLKKIFFEQIQKIASGNISVAILFWLRSIESIKEHELTLSSQVDFNLTFLSHLSMEDRFTLGAIVQHDALSIEDHARIFRQSGQKSKQALLNLAQSGIVQDIDATFRIHPFLYRHVVRSLKLQNIIH